MDLTIKQLGQIDFTDLSSLKVGPPPLFPPVFYLPVRLERWLLVVLLLELLLVVMSCRHSSSSQR